MHGSLSWPVHSLPQANGKTVLRTVFGRRPALVLVFEPLDHPISGQMRVYMAPSRMPDRFTTRSAPSHTLPAVQNDFVQVLIVFLASLASRS